MDAMRDNNQVAAEKCGWRVNEWAAATGTSRSQAYKLLDDGRIASVKLGTARIITTPPREFLASLAAA